jgi:signal transduction histidine kinase
MDRHPGYPSLPLLCAAVGIILFLAVIFTPLSWLRLLLFISSALFCALAWLYVKAARQTEPAGRSGAELPAAATAGTTPVQQRNNDERVIVINKFASVVSHELKNPLSSLKNIAYFLNKTIKTDDERTQHMLSLLTTEIERLNRLITEMLDLSRVKKLTKVPSKLNELFEQAIAAVQFSDTIRLTKDLAPAEAVVDPERFKQVFVNLLTNARDAMPNGGDLSVTMSKRDHSIDILVKDTGTGMDPETLAQIFDPMFTTKTKVLGLGLTVAKEIVSMHNGTITAASEKGKGTEIRIVLPTREA